MNHRILYYIFIYLLLLTIIHAQEPELIGPFGGRAIFIKIHPANSAEVYVSSYTNGFFRKEQDGTVHIIKNGFGHEAVQFFELSKSNPNIILTGDFNYIISKDNGKSWKYLFDSEYVTFGVINPLDSRMIYVFRKNNELWKSFDEGDSWVKLMTFENKLCTMTIAPNDTALLYLTTLDGIYRSTNAGNNWEKMSSAGGWRTFKMSINPLNKNSIYLHKEGLLLKSEDGGRTLRDLGLTEVSDFVVNPKDTTIIYTLSGDPVFVPDGAILKTTDEGKNWTQVKNGIETQYIFGRALEINPDNPEEVYAGIGDLGVFKTTNGGANWFLTDICNQDVKEIYINPDNPNHIITTQYGWDIMHTTDGGRSWSKPDLFPMDSIPAEWRNYISFNPFNSSEGFYSREGILYKTTDGGNSFYERNIIPQVICVRYHDFVEGLIFAAKYKENTSEWEWLKSTDDGLSWKSYAGKVPMLRYYFHKNDPYLVYSFDYDKIYKSSDLGITSEIKNNGLIYSEPGYLSTINALAVDYNNANILYCGQRHGLLKSTNGGDSWFRIDSTLRTMYNSVNISSIWLDRNKPGRIYIGREITGTAYTSSFSYGGLLLTEDDGKHWKTVFDDEVCKGIFMQSGIVKDEKNGYIYFNTNFGILKFLDTLTVTSVKKISAVLPEEVSLYQNFPNPFNPETKIRFAIKERARISINLYDMLGKEVAKFIDEEMEPGSYELTFNGSGLAGGVYIYQLEFGNKIIQRKMLLMK